MKVWLLDTGPIVAYLDADDPFHDVAAKALDDFNGQLITSGAVVTEAMHFVSADFRGPGLLVDFFHSSRTRVVECCQPEDLKQAVRLMKKYADTPMDFADATLVLLAEALRQNHVCTLDRRGFSAYRTATGRHFNLALDLSG